MLNLISKKNLLALSLVPVLLSGCLQDKIDEEIEKSSKESEVRHEVEGHTDEQHENEEAISDEQVEAIEELEGVSPEEAASNIVIDSRSELKTDKLVSVKNPKDLEDVSNYISQQFFLYHSKSIGAEEFLTTMKPYFHEEFLDLLPSEEEMILQTFTTLQDMFIAQLGSPITSYFHTDVQLLRHQTEANFYRKYVLKNGKEIYYQTLMKQDEEGMWKMIDDSPSPAYEILPETENAFKETIIQNKESGEE